MTRRNFLSSLAVGAAAFPRIAHAALSPIKITRVRIYQPPNLNQLFNQSNMLCTQVGIPTVGKGVGMPSHRKLFAKMGLNMVQ